MAERSEFELPVPVSKTARRQHHVKLCDIEASCEALPPRTAFVTRCRFVVEANGAKVDCPQRQNQSRCCSCRTRRTLPLNVATVTPDRNGVPDHEGDSSQRRKL